MSESNDTLSKKLSNMATLNVNSSTPDKKRKSESDPSSPPENKVGKYEKKDLYEMGEFLFSNIIAPKIASAVEKAVTNSISKIEAQIVEIRGEQEGLTNRVSTLEKNQMDIDEIKSQVVPEVTNKVTETVNVQWKLFLTEEISKNDSMLIITCKDGSCAATTDFFGKFCSEKLKMSKEDIEKVETKSIHSSKNAKNTVFVTVGSIFQRNLCLKHSGNLTRGTYIDKNVPKRYLAKYRSMKSQAWRLRTAKNVSTKIDFEGPFLVLRYKKKESENVKYSWIIHDSYLPKAEAPKSEYTPPEGTVVTPVLDIKNLVVLSGFKSESEEEEKLAEVRGFFSKADSELLTKCEVKNASTLVLHFSSLPNECIKRYDGKMHNNNKIKLELV